MGLAKRMTDFYFVLPTIFPPTAYNLIAIIQPTTLWPIFGRHRALASSIELQLLSVCLAQGAANNIGEWCCIASAL